MASLDANKPFVLTNSYTGGERILAISAADSKTPHMLSWRPGNDSSEPSGKSSPPKNAQWFLTETDAPPFYHLHTLSGGPSLALDVLNDNGTGSVSLYMSETGVYTGQYWRFDVWADADPAGEGYKYRLSNNFTGLDLHLDVYSDTLGPHLARGDATGQYWQVGGIQSDAKATTSATGGGSSNPTATGATAADTAVASGELLSTGAIAGIAIGSVAALSLLTGVLAYLFLRASRRRRRETDELFLVTNKLATEESESSGPPPPGYERVLAVRQGAPVELSAAQRQAAELLGVPMQMVGELPDRRYSRN